MTATLIPQMKYEIAQLSYEELAKEAAEKLKR
jgi:hypothetical protein